MTGIEASIDFTVHIEVCEYIEVVGHGLEPRDIYLKWKYADTYTEIKSEQLQDFRKDTQNLITFFGDNYFDKEFYDYNDRGVSRPSGWVPGSSRLIDYWHKWGPLYPVKDSQVSLAEIISVCSVAYSLELAWRALHGDENAFPFLVQFFDSVSDYLLEEDEQYLRRRDNLYWTALPLHQKSRFDMSMWVPRYDRPSFVDGIPSHIFFQHPDFLKTEDDDWSARYSFMTEQVLNYMAYYVSQQRLSFEMSIQGDALKFVGGVKNAICAYLMYEIVGKKQESRKLCACGCNRVLPRNKRFYATAECAARVKRGKIPRRLKSWLRTKKSRGEINDEMYQELCITVNELYTDGKSEAEIRQELRGLILTTQL